MGFSLGSAFKNLHKAMPGVGSSDPKKALKNLHNAMPGSDQLKNQKVEQDSSKVGSASDRMGNLVRAEWDDYVTRFQPYDKKIIGLATGQEDNEQAIVRARESVGGSFDVAQGTLQRNQERLGLSNAADEVADQNRNTATARISSEINAINGTRLHAQDRDLSLMAGDAAAGLKSGRLSGA